MKNIVKSVLMLGDATAPLTLLSNALQCNESQITRSDSASLNSIMQGLDAAPDAIVATMLSHADSNPASDLTELTEAYAFIDAIRLTRNVHGRLPRYAIGLLPQAQGISKSAIGAAVGSLVRYITSDLLYDEICVNLISYPDSVVGHQRAADTAQALMSGLLDTVRGQTFVLSEN